MAYFFSPLTSVMILNNSNFYIPEKGRFSNEGTHAKSKTIPRELNK